VVNIPNAGSRGTDLSVSKSFAKSLNVVLGYFVIPHRLMLGEGLVWTAMKIPALTPHHYMVTFVSIGLMNGMCPTLM